MGEHLLHAFMNFEERTKWDKTCLDFQFYPGPEGKELVHMKLHAPPYSDRDLLSFHTVARHQDGHILIYLRQADDAFLPQNGSVRGHALLNATLIEDLEGGGVRFTSTNIVDGNLMCKPPERIMNAVVPKEMHRWVQSLEGQCAKLKSKRISPKSLPCAKLFQLSGKLVPIGCCLEQSIDEPPKSPGVLRNDSFGSDIKCVTNFASYLQTASTPSLSEGDLADDLDDSWLEDDLPEVTTIMSSLDSSHTPGLLGCFFVIMHHVPPCLRKWSRILLIESCCHCGSKVI